MTCRSKGMWMTGVTFVVTALVAAFKEFEADYYAKALWIIWAGHSWNFFAYAFDRGMLPSVFVELDGQGKGEPGYRTFYFWGTAVIYSGFLSIIVFAG